MPWFKNCSLCGRVLEVMIVALVSLLGVHYFAPGDAARLCVGLVAAYLPARVLLARDEAAGVGARYGLLLAWSILGVAVTLSIYHCTGGDSALMSLPDLRSDDRRYFQWALSTVDSDVPRPRLTFVGHPFIVAVLFHTLGVHIVWPLVMNVACTLLAIVFTGKTAVILVAAPGTATRRRVMTTTIFICSLLFYMLSLNTKVLKEPLCYLAVAMAGLALAVHSSQAELTRRRWVKTLVLMSVGSLLLAVVRTSYVYFLILGVAVTSLSRTHLRERLKRGGVLLGITLVALGAGLLLSLYPLSQQVNTVTGGGTMPKLFITNGPQQPYLDIIGQYFNYPVWKRLLLLPFTAAVQFIIPFPWCYSPTGHSSFMEMLPRLREMWYVVGGLSLFYYLFMSWRRGNGGLGTWALWPAMVYLIIAYIVGGSVTRYILPFELLFVPVAVFVLYKLKQGMYRNVFIVWAVFFLVVLAATLVICHDIQVDYMRDYYHLQG